MRTVRYVLTFIFIVLLVATCAKQPVHGQLRDVDVNLTTMSTHYVSGDYNAHNEGVLFDYTVDSVRVWNQPVEVQMTGGVYDNSFHNPSVVAGIAFEMDVHQYVDVQMRVGAVTGYEGMRKALFGTRGPNGTVPMVSQMIEIGREPVQVALIHVPGAVGLGITID